MARLPNLDKDQLKPEDLKFYDVIADSRGGVRGPYGVLLHSPDLAARVAHTGSYVRYHLELPEALRETIIATAREIKSPYEFSAHARLARQAGSPKTPSRLSHTARHHRGSRAMRSAWSATCRSYSATTRSAMRHSMRCGIASACKRRWRSPLWWGIICSSVRS
jgi:alkylhydroperoxidase family enzyme